MERNTIENLIDLPICDNVVRQYGKYMKKVNGQLIKITYDWFERKNGYKYKLSLTRQQYDEMKTLVSPKDIDGNSLTFDKFCDILIPILSTCQYNSNDDYSILVAFDSFDKNNDQYIQIDELENLIHIIGKSVSREKIRCLINKVDFDHDGQLNYDEFRQFIICGYARELLMMDITRDIVYSNDNIYIPAYADR